MIDVALGGRAAEEMIFGREDVTSGCSSDLQRATDVAARMIRVSGEPQIRQSRDQADAAVSLRITVSAIRSDSWRMGMTRAFTCLGKRRMRLRARSSSSWIRVLEGRRIC